LLDPLADYALPPDLVPPPDLPSLSLANLPRTAVWAEAPGSSARLPCDIQVGHKHIRDKSVCNYRKIGQRPLSRKSGKSMLMKNPREYNHSVCSAQWWCTTERKEFYPP
jgi:hypothetical protein